MRLDIYMFENGMVESRSRAQNLIKIGKVSVDGKTVFAPSFDIKDGDKIEISEENFASLGAFKLKKALLDFDFSPKNLVCLDIGASNGGFTEILLKNGAKKVFALDVGECALPDYLREDERVIVRDKLNARYLTKDDIGEKVSLITIDVSFISLKLILPACLPVLNNGGHVIALIKPQFEVTKKDLTKTGLVNDKKLLTKVVDDIRSYSASLGFKVLGLTEIPVLFKDKNLEYLIFLQKQD